MKSTAKQNSQPSPVQPKPFFNKGEGGSFFSDSSEQKQSFFNASPIQASMTVGQPDDPYEQEAEKVSSQVVEGFDQASSIQRKLAGFGLQPFGIQPFAIGSRISRKLQKTISRTALTVQAKCDQCEEEEKMQKKSEAIQFAGEGSTVSPAIESKIQSMRGSGQPMDTVTQSAMESSFGADFSNVRIHTNSQAAQMSTDLNAHAFTVGSDIFFNEGRYQPNTKQGAGLLAHELTHTVQQGASVQNKSINRHPLLSSLSSHAVAHLSAMNGGSSALSRQEIAQLQAMPENQMKMQQQQILQMKEVDKVQKKGNVGIMRSCFGGGSSTPATPTLKRTVTTQPVSFGCGGFNMAAIFSVDNATSSTNGFIVQKVTFNLNREKCAGGNSNFSKTYWEAWQVRNGIAYIGTSSARHDSDGRGDNFQVPSAPSHKGVNYLEGKAKYIDGYTEPNSWGNIPEAGSLPATTSQPAGWTDAGTIHRWIKSEFNCCVTPNTDTFTHQK